jgi:hypothetical protein
MLNHACDCISLSAWRPIASLETRLTWRQHCFIETSFLVYICTNKTLTAFLDIVGNNIPVFFIQDAILFPDLIHAVKPKPDREIPQAATAHDSAWDFFSQQPSSLHTLFWAMSGHGTVSATIQL